MYSGILMHAYLWGIFEGLNGVKTMKILRH
jgi:hypothetical protein